MFGKKKKGFDALTPVQQKWAKALNNKTMFRDLVDDAICDGDMARLQYALDNYPPKRKSDGHETNHEHHLFILSTINTKQPEMLRAIIDAWGSDPFCVVTYISDRKFSTEEMTKIYFFAWEDKKNCDLDILKILLDKYYDPNPSGYDVTYRKEIAPKVILRSGLTDAIDMLLDVEDARYRDVLKYARKYGSLDTLKYVLSMPEKQKFDGQKDINNQLSDTLEYYSESLTLDQLQAFLDAKASPNVLDQKIISNIVFREEKDILDLLLKHGLDIEKYGYEALARLKTEKPHSLMVQYLCDLLEKVKSGVVEKDPYTLFQGDCLKLEVMLSHNKMLTHIFNFTLCEEIKIIENKETGQLAMDSIPFIKLQPETISFLEKKFLEKNGKQDVLDRRIQKNTQKSTPGMKG